MAKQPVGKFALVLHAHLPYVMAHGRWPHGTDWLCECAAETYLPLLDVLHRLVREGHSPKLTLGLTPVLTEQLADPAFQKEFVQYLKARIEAARDDEREFRREGLEHRARLARRWEDHFAGVLSRFRGNYGGDLIAAFRNLQDAGHIEIITSAATHGYLPLIGQDVNVQAQVKVGAASYEQHFGRAPRGFWLPECGYRPRYEWASPVKDAGPTTPVLRKGVEEFLAESGLRYFVIESHLLRGGEPIGVYLSRFGALETLWRQFSDSCPPQPEDVERSPHDLFLVGPTREGQDPVAIFTRDPATGAQVWSGDTGYPGDGWYLDFHKKHFPGGHRYWRVTESGSDLGAKQEYEPARAAERVPDHASHFKGLVKGLLQEHRDRTGRAGVLCAPYDAELFGHWWFEGPEWLYDVLKAIDADPELEAVTCEEALAATPPTTVVALPEGSWGQGGFHWVWLNEWNEWIWKRVYQAEREMQELVEEFGSRKDDRLHGVLEQAARELLLLESSDWQFLISTWSARDYAEARAADHFESFERLRDLARRYGRGEPVDAAEWTFLHECRERDRAFARIDLNWFARLEHPIG